MSAFTSAEHAVRAAAWSVIDQAVPYAVTYTAHGFDVVELSKITKKDKIAEVIHALAETIRFSDNVVEDKAGAQERAEESARRVEAASQIARGDST